MRLNEKKLRALIVEAINEKRRFGFGKSKEKSKEAPPENKDKPSPASSSEPLPAGNYTPAGDSYTINSKEVKSISSKEGKYTVTYKDGSTEEMDSSDSMVSKIVNKEDLDKKRLTPASAPTKKSGGSSKKSGGSAAKISNIQKIIGADADGKWGSGTTAKWKEWISSEEGMRGVAAIVKEKGITLSENNSLSRLQLRNLLETAAFFPYLSEAEESNPETGETESDSADTAAGKKPIPDEVKSFIEKNKGNAANIAKTLGYPGNLSGVDQMAKDVVEKAKSGEAAEGEETIEASPEEQKKGFLEADRDDSAWAGKRTRDANVLDEKLSKFGDVYGDIPQGGDTSEVNLHGALSREGGCPGLHVSFVRTMDEFKTQHPGETFQDFIQLEIETSRAFTVNPATMLKGLFSGDLKGLGFLQGVVDSALGLNNKNDKTMASFKGFGMETLNFYDGDSSLAGEIFYDSTAKSILYDSATGDYIMGKILLSDDKEYIYYDQSYSYTQAAEQKEEEGGDSSEPVKESMLRRKENRKLAQILHKYDII